MNISLKRKLILENPQRAPDGAGGFDETWKALGAHWAQVEVRGGGSGQAPEGDVSRIGYLITIRAAPIGSFRRPRAGQRFKEGARFFAIDAVCEAENPLYLEIWAREVSLK